MTGLVLCDDLIFTSKVTATARAQSIGMRTAKTADEAKAIAAKVPVACAILDLHVEKLNIAEMVKTLRVAGVQTVIGFGSHVDYSRLKSARDAGCDYVMPRSQFVDLLEDQLAAWVTGRVK